MRISDWSSDVCSSDLSQVVHDPTELLLAHLVVHEGVVGRQGVVEDRPAQRGLAGLALHTRLDRRLQADLVAVYRHDRLGLPRAATALAGLLRPPGRQEPQAHATVPGWPVPRDAAP